MNSLLKTTTAGAVAPQDFMTAFESKILAMETLAEVELLFKKLKFLGTHLDPFNPDTSIECQQIMSQLGLHLYLDNPYQMTNMLLRLLDKSEEQINKLKH